MSWSNRTWKENVIYHVCMWPAKIERKIRAHSVNKPRNESSTNYLLSEHINIDEAVQQSYEGLSEADPVLEHFEGRRSFADYFYPSISKYIWYGFE